jgi:hypothetical protein
VALWAVAHKDLLGAEQAVGRPAIAPEAMRLVQVAPATPGDASSDDVCFRIGPFANREQLSVATQRLLGLGVPFVERDIGARQIRAFRLFLGPYPSLQAAQVAEQRLAAAGVADHYVKQDGETGPIVSLGLFSQQEGAEAVRSDVAGKGFRPEVRVEDRMLAATFWLELMDAAANRRSAGVLTAGAWGDARARVREIQC